MERLEVIEGRGGAEVVLVDEGHRKPALRGIPGHRDPVEPGPYDDHVESSVRQSAEVARHPLVIVR